MKNTSPRTIIGLVLATGLSSVVAQLLTIRECLSQFNGNEIVIALILFNWLILGGIGTSLARWVIHRPQWVAVEPLVWMSLAISTIPPLQILSIRLFRDAVFLHGASVGFYPTFLFILMAILPYGLLIGFVLPYSLFVLRRAHPRYTGTRIYILDNLGDIAGGALFSFVLVLWFTPMQALLWANLPLVTLCCLAPLAVNSISVRLRIWLGVVISLFCLIAGVYVEFASLQPREGRLVDYRESLYGRITVHENRHQYTLFSDGVPQFSSQNQVAAEESVHYALSQLDRVERLMLISVEGGVIQEIYKYRPKRIDYVELNPAVTRVLIDYGLIAPHFKLNVYHSDGRRFLATADTHYDAVIVNLPEPDTFQINRFYTTQFFDLVHQRLAEDGIYCFFMQGYDNYLAEPQRQKISALYNSVSKYFSSVVLIPGQKICFLCRNGPISTDIPALLSKKGIHTDYIHGYYAGNVSADRIDQLNGLVDPEAPINSDLSPVLMRIMFTQWFAKHAASPRVFLAVIFLLGIGYLIRTNREEFVLFTTGWMTMGCEILVIFAFQVFFGYIYFQIGLIVTVFLAGLLPGALLGHRLVKRSRRWLMITDALLIMLMGCFILLLESIGAGLPRLFYLIFGFATSVVCGFQFPVALHIHGDSNPSAMHFFSADLVGAASGCLFTSILLIPYLGISGAALVLVGIKSVSFIATSFRHDNIHPPRHTTI